MHWSLIVVCNPLGRVVKTDKKEKNEKFPPDTKMLMYCDSLGGVTPSHLTKKAREFLTKRFKVEYPGEPAKQFTPETIFNCRAELPKQDNHCDCGVFMLHYIQTLIELEITELPICKPELFRMADIPAKRARIRDEIEMEAQMNPVPTPTPATDQSQSDSVMALSQLLSPKKCDGEESPQKQSPPHYNTEKKEDLFTEAVLANDD